ncbi:MAG: TraM recognition domain-containing protein [Spiroplasma phoeniceum]|nr:MAG: TraM recognition domain-containing protein [Spiroplasma phoeniceum]UZQ32417.1 MAG: TraM recognition domain-containing protein [Spiroplasma phoeniceum]
MSLFDFSEQYYRDNTKHYLLILLDVMKKYKLDITLNNIIEDFNIEKLLKLVDVKSVNYDMLSNNFVEKEISGIISKLDITNMQLNNSIVISSILLELIIKHKTILFSINSLKYPELAGSVGKIIIQDLKELTTLKPVNQKINVILDEFNVYASETIISLINKSRSFNYQCFLSFQTINDLKTNNINLTYTIFANVITIVCHNIKDPNTAEYVASIFDTQETEKLTW